MTPARLGAVAAELAENVADRDRAHLGAGHAGNLEHRHAAAGRLAARSRSPCRRARRRAASCGSYPWWRRWRWRRPARRARAPRRRCAARAWTSLRLLSRVSGDGDLDKVAHDLLDVAADIADLGELGRLDLEERRAGELGQPARDLGLADAGRADHQDVLRHHLFAQLVVELQPAPAVAQRDRDRALGVALADDEAVELGDDFAGEKSVMGLSRRPQCAGFRSAASRW